MPDDIKPVTSDPEATKPAAAPASSSVQVASIVCNAVVDVAAVLVLGALMWSKIIGTDVGVVLIATIAGALLGQAKGGKGGGKGLQTGATAAIVLGLASVGSRILRA